MKNIVLNLILMTFLSSCSSNTELDNSFSTNTSDVNLYNQAMIKLKKKEFEEAIEIFTELEIQYPYSPWAARGQLFTGFAHYTANEYDEAILTLSKFVEFI